ncbi:G-protein coupled receptor 39 [Latimeria chalumnae]|nr:PREDICTED: G-protein coupled receptor 39 [Latimeria chalumnae]|eukprot:XP_006003579.1 PREDICTED: G-protein coupled receptor 39 [Latimeria chalumnae]
MDLTTLDCTDVFNHEHVPEFELDFVIKVTLTLFYSVILLAGIVGNSITIKVTQVLQKKGYLQKSVTDHMISLAASDLLVLLLGMPVELYSVIWDPFATRSGNAACKIYNFLFETCSYATILNIATLSFERYIAICHPFKYKSFSGSRTVKLICFVWVTSICIALPLLFAMGIEDPLEPFAVPTLLSGYQGPALPNPCNKVKSNFTICTSLTSKWTLFQSSIFCAFILYIVVLVSVAFMCRKMMRALISMKKSAVAVKKGRSNDQLMSKKESPEAKASRKQTIIFLGLIVTTLALCWMPNQIRRIMAAARPKQDWTRTYFRAYITLLPIADTFFYLSSVVNPLLYNFSSRQFRSVFLQVLRCHLTIEHVNKRTLRTAPFSSVGSRVRSIRPLLIASFRRAPSSQKTNERVVLRTFMPENDLDCSPQNMDQAVSSLEPNAQIRPPETVLESSQTEEEHLSESKI